MDKMKNAIVILFFLQIAGAFSSSGGIGSRYEYSNRASFKEFSLRMRSGFDLEKLPPNLEGVFHSIDTRFGPNDKTARYRYWLLWKECGARNSLLYFPNGFEYEIRSKTEKMYFLSLDTIRVETTGADGKTKEIKCYEVILGDKNGSLYLSRTPSKFLEGEVMARLKAEQAPVFASAGEPRYLDPGPPPPRESYDGIRKATPAEKKHIEEVLRKNGEFPDQGYRKSALNKLLIAGLALMALIVFVLILRTSAAMDKERR